MNIYGIRKLGREFCQTEGSEHYKTGEIEPIELIIDIGAGKDFCIGNIIKYAVRYKEKGNKEDLKKISDYAHILAGIEIEEEEERELKQEDINYAHILAGIEIEEEERELKQEDIKRSLSQ